MFKAVNNEYSYLGFFFGFFYSLDGSPKGLSLCMCRTNKYLLDSSTYTSEYVLCLLMYIASQTAHNPFFFYLLIRLKRSEWLGYTSCGKKCKWLKRGKYCVLAGCLRLMVGKVALYSNWHDLPHLGWRPNNFSVFLLFKCPVCLHSGHCYTLINLSEFDSYRLIGWDSENNSELQGKERAGALYQVKA